MKQKIRITYLIQRGAERLDQAVGKAADKADRIGEQEILAAAQGYLSNGGVQRGKQHILRHNHLFLFSARQFHQFVQQRGFACVGISDQRGLRIRSLGPFSSLDFAFLLHPFQFAPQFADTPLDFSPVQLNLLFTGSLVAQGTAGSALAPQRVSESHKSRQHILKSGRFHLHFSLFGPGSP